jgi:hypothetical protein
VVLAATTAIQNITPKYGSENSDMKLKTNIRPVVAPAPGIIPISNPYNVPAINAKISITLSLKNFVLDNYLYQKQKKFAKVVKKIKKVKKKFNE